MIVIHPTDCTTTELKGLYAGQNDVVLLNEQSSDKEICHALYHSPASETIMILGHGYDGGLFSRFDDKLPMFDRIIVGHKHAYYLRYHRVIGIWCFAYDYAVKENIHGLFSGMFISEIEEAEEWNVETTADEIKREFVKFVERLRLLLDEETPWHEIPERLRQMDDVKSPLTLFNYSSIYYY